MRCLFFLAAIFSFFLYPMSIYAQAVPPPPPADIIAEEALIAEDAVLDEDTVEDNIVLQDQQDTDAFDELDNDYVTSLNQAVPPVYPPSIIDSGVYNTQVSINMDLVPEHSADLVTID